MADIVDRATRSRMMAGIGGKDTAPELIVRRFLHRAGLRFRLHRRDLPGRPDLVLTRFCVAVLVHGCFWHRHPGCRFATTPSTNTGFWRAKFAANVARDRRTLRELRRRGWRPIVVWECNLTPSRLSALVRDVRQTKDHGGKCG
ncbi:MAG: DNA mismatch endonuclease Vsr [Gemmatimonadaceae bacterium]|nr:DNA mismatch endonuclease Vsr [Gemmatimonadaceae bacterium]